MSFYLGIDLTDQYAMVSYYQLNSDEPVTVSTVAGSEVYQIPVVLAKKKGLGQWFYGEEAKRMARAGEMICIENLYQRALDREEIFIEDECFQAIDLLAVFLKRLISLTQKLGNPTYFDKLVVTVPEVNREVVTLFHEISEIFGLKENMLSVVDHKECFYYYALSQQSELWLHDVILFEATDNQVAYYHLKRNLHTVPQVVTIEESKKYVLDYDKDASFQRVLENAFSGKIVSTCYLSGNGFEGNWLHASLNYLCKGRRAFLGNNLYTKGACYCAALIDNRGTWPFVYFGQHEMKFNLSLKVRNKGKHQFLDLVEAGCNWFEADTVYDVILESGNELSFWKQLPHSNEAKVESLELTDLPERPERTTRLRIHAKAVSDTGVELEITDLGFGDFFKSSDKVWKYTMNI